MASSDVQFRALTRAAQLMGGSAEFAKHLGVPESMLEMWIAERFIPTDIFLRIVDIIVDRKIDAVKD